MKKGLVTGAGGGIGTAVVKRMLAESVDVLAVDRDEGALMRLKDTGAETLNVDLTDPAERAELVRVCGNLDYLVNAAGVIAMIPIERVIPLDWEKILKVNAEATFFLCQAFAATLRPNGAIVNISSIAAKTGATAETAVYAASKAAVLSITRSFANALAPRGIRVNAVCPGLIDTQMNDKVVVDLSARDSMEAEEWRAKRVTSVPLGREADPSECASAIWYLLSDDSSYITGQSLNVSGGLVNW